MSQPPTSFTQGSLYIAGFTQARAPHAGLIIPSSSTSGHLVHIRIDRNTSPVWAFESRVQRIAGDMFISTLLKLRDISVGEITAEQLKEAAASVPAPQNDDFGECLPWVTRVIQRLHAMGMLKLADTDKLREEFEEFAAGNTTFATRQKFPNVKVSEFCS